MTRTPGPDTSDSPARLRVSSSAFSHHYDSSLYDPMRDRVDERPLAVGPLRVPEVDLAEIDLFHLNWPEWVAFDDIEVHRSALRTLAKFSVPVVWTVHNLTPHEKDAITYDPIFQLWAGHVDALIHHSAWGKDRFAARYAVPRETPQLVIPHGHFGALYPSAAPVDLHLGDDTEPDAGPGADADADAGTGSGTSPGPGPGWPKARHEAALGLDPAPLRIGLVGAPRVEKDLQGFFAGVARSSRTDLEVVCWSLAADEPRPADPRIRVAEPYEMVDADTYAHRLGACDVIALPFGDGGEMLATGTASDAVGVGLPALTSSWGYLTEHLGEAAIPMGDDPESIGAALDALTPDALARARAATAELRRAYTWPAIADRTFALFTEVVAGRA